MSDEAETETQGSDLADPAPAAGDAAPAAVDRAIALQRAGQHADAIKVYEAILREQPGEIRAWVNLGVSLRSSGRLPASVAAYRRALALQPDSAGIWGNLGNVLRQLGQRDEAIACQERALALEPGGPGALYNLALLLCDLGRWREALACFDRAIAAGRPRPELRLDRAMALIAAGDYLAGFAGFEARLELPEAAPTGSAAPLWDGAPLDGKSILVQVEQGPRDTLTFLRYVPALAARGGRVTVAAPATMAEMIAALPGVALVVPAGRAAPPTDLRVALNSLPRLFQTQPDTVPQDVPYLRLPAGRVRRDWLGTAPGDTALKIGIVWADRPRGRAADRDRWARACPFPEFLRLAGIPGTVLFRLQTGPAAADRDRHGAGALVRDPAGEFGDLIQAAELIDQLDLVVGVDSAATILAGALGKPGMVVLPPGSDWRWVGPESGDRADRTPWFPTLRLFRQQPGEDWAPLFDRIAQTVARIAAGVAGNQAAPRVAGVLAVAPAILPAASSSAPDEPAARPSADVTPAPVAVAPAPLFVRAAEHAPPVAAPDEPAAAGLAGAELAASGPTAVAAFLRAQLDPQSLLVDVGAGLHGLIDALPGRGAEGGMQAIAIGTDASALAALRAAAEEAGMAGAVETVHAGLGAKSVPAASEAPPQTTLDTLLADRGDLAGRRLLLHLGPDLRMAEIVAGALDLLAQQRIAALLWHADPGQFAGAGAERWTRLLDSLSQLGFRHFRLPHDARGGKLVPYVPLPEATTVFSLARGVTAAGAYVGAGDPEGGIDYATLDAATRHDRTALLMAKHGTDVGRWAHASSLAAGAEERAALAAPHLAGAGGVLDLGAGLMALQRHLPPETRYVPADLVKRRADTVLVDLNQGDFPEGSFGAVAMLDVLQFVHDGAGVLARARAAARRLVLIYPLSDGQDTEQRVEAGWFNAFSRATLESQLARAGWAVALHRQEDGYDLFVCDAAGAAR